MPAKQTNAGEYASQLLKLVFQAVNYPNVADNASSGPFTNLFVSLHTGSPGATGAQNTTEATYSSYARVSVPRNSGGWIVTANSVSPASTVIFPASTAGNETEGFFAIGTSSIGAGHLLYFGSVSPTISVVGSGITPELTTGSAVTET
jgi:hypothetical protein